MDLDVEYLGVKSKMGIVFPIGNRHKSAQTGTMQFVKGKPQKMKKEDAEKLCSMNSDFRIVGATVEAKAEAKAEVMADAPKAPKKIKKIVKPGVDMDEEILSKLGE